jgi:anti-sigma regulatory factor (Ser/Thr protein kinase)
MDGYGRAMSPVQTQWTSLLDIELAGLSAPQQARWMMREQLAGDVSVSFLRDLLLATSEIVTNAIRYAPGPCRLSLQRADGASRLRVGVVDSSPEMPPTFEALMDPDSNGRGLLIVDTVASAWGSRPVEQGKEVWFEMTPDQRS